MIFTFNGCRRESDSGTGRPLGGQGVPTSNKLAILESRRKFGGNSFAGLSVPNE
ncbi:hypothetical protein [Pseudomonas aeruginosa]|uniref:hypothetical protein n=1 Tax=Pseudomonas aeruginosa TaxID=287 RepID=UPI001647CA3C|nr:hypothetical protein [Pseudomonas aeruginosa]